MPNRFPATKFAPRVFGQGVVGRPRVLDLLAGGANRPVTVVRGFPGSGKTTLVAEWVESWRAESPSRRAMAWVSCDEGDREPAVLWSALLVALENAADVDIDVSPLETPEWTPELAAAAVVNELMARADTDGGETAFGETDRDRGRGAAPPAAPSSTNERTVDELVIVFDEAERAGQAIATLGSLIERVPAGVRVVFTTRVDLPLPLQQLRVRRLVCELQQTDLNLTLEESRELLETIDNRVDATAPNRTEVAIGDQTPSDVATWDDETLEAVYGQTEGWLAPYVLVAADGGHVADAMASRGAPEPAGAQSPPLEEFFRDTVTALNPALQNFLLDIALLDECTAADCRAIIDGRRGDELLREVEARGLFLVSTNGTGNYRLHRLFRRYLRHQRNGRELQRDLEIHRRAAAWYGSEGRHRLAVRHHVAAGDVVAALRMVGAQLWNTALACGDDGLEAWLGELSDDAVRAANSAEAAAVYGLALIAIGDVVRGRQWLEMIGRGTDHLDGSDAVATGVNMHNMEGVESGGVQQIASLGWLGLAWRHGDPFAAEAGLQRLEQLRRHAVKWPSVLESVLAVDTRTWLGDLAGTRQLYERKVGSSDGSSVDDVFVTCAYAYAVAVEGQLRLATSLAEWALARADALGVAERWPVIIARRSLGIVAYEQGRLDEAHEVLSQAVNRVDDIPSQVLLARVALARVELALGHVEETLNTIKLTTGADVRDGHSPLRDHIVSIDIRAALAVGDLGRAHDLVAHLYSPRRASMLRARVALASGELEDAAAALEELESVESPETTRTRLDRLVVSARLARKRKDEAVAERLVGDALELAMPETAVRPFFEDGLDLWPTLRRALSSWPQQLFHDRALEMANHCRSLRHYPPSMNEQASGSSVLSSLRPREIEVLRLIGQRLSNAEIAATLYISPNTLKTHTRSLYRKLGVTRRTEAKEIAERLHIY